VNINEYLPPRVAIIEMHGVIGPRVRPTEFTKLLQEVGANARFKAVVLDVDSPGGSAFASEDIYFAAKKLATKKPLIAAVRGVGASGSYMVAVAAERIFALPTAVIGSIGVISARPMVQELLEKVGVEMIVAKAGASKDAGSLFRQPTPEELEREQELLNDVHSRFQEIVAEGRTNLTPERVTELATGDIHLGTKALELGLIDELGTLDDAVEHAAELAGIKPATMVLRPRRSLAQMLMTRGASAVVDAMGEATVEALAERLYTRSLGLPLR